MDQLLPAGFRSFPADEELITCYLARKAMDASFTSPAIRDVDRPLQVRAVGPAMRAACRRATSSALGAASTCPACAPAARRGAGTGSQTGKDKAVHGRDGRLVGRRKTLVFYRGRAPRGEKTGWAMHEYTMGERSSSAPLRGAQSEWVICKVFVRKHPRGDERKVAPEEAVRDQDSTQGHLLPVLPDGCDGHEQEAAPPAVVTDSQHTISHSGAHVMEGNEKDHHQQQHHHHQMVHEELLLMIDHHGRCGASPSWFNHDDQLGSHCSALPVMQMQSDDADYYLPGLLEYDGCDDLPNDAGSGLLDTGGEVNRRAEIITSATIGPLHFDGFYWNFGF
ncbi:NAC domain-containing protein 79-like [Panicum hallii]|uniref:NAC domain-containing protein 79-like n=1 Tax=Panicum hallii TaxID=206008 RepID=UPI000DF4D828|nr:NAC domain-containing protein 79-like [Panicum hallii]